MALNKNKFYEVKDFLYKKKKLIMVLTLNPINYITYTPLIRRNFSENNRNFLCENCLDAYRFVRNILSATNKNSTFYV